MPKFKDNDLYSGVNAIADRNNLIWDGQYGSPYDIEAMILKQLRDRKEMEGFSYLFDHTKRFKPRGRGRLSPVMAISSPYLEDTPDLRREAEAFANRFGLAVRVNDPAFRIYATEGTLPIVFWRPDLHSAV